jgi:formylglycine-generating enzyme required for sulfatase activity
MCSSAYWQRTSCAGTGRAHRAAAVTAGSRHRLLIITNLAAALLLAAGTGPARGQAAARPAPYRDSIPATLVSFEMVPVPGGSVTLDSPAGARVVAVTPFWIGKTEVTWDEYDVWVYRLDLVAGAPGGGDSADATARPSRPYGAPDRGFGHHGYPALAMTYTAAQGYCAWLSARTGRHYGLPSDAQWTRALAAGLGADTSLSAERRDALAWDAGNAAHQAHAVATKHADALGLYDLLGNVAEWVTVPDGPPVVRGGSWADPPARVGPRARAAQTPAWNETDPQFPKSRWWLADAPFVGFRIVLLTP